MSIEYSVSLEPKGQESFHAVDKVVMRHAFDIHNALGRFCDEGIYQEELARRCRASNLEVHRELLLRASFLDFSKPYYIDMLVDRGVIYELKAVEALNGQHVKQVINYLLLSDLNHGKLVNFRPVSVESRFVSTRLHISDRRDVRMDDGAWTAGDKESERLREILRGLLADWGAFLDASLYREALLHFLGGEEIGIQAIEIVVEGRIVGTQSLRVLNAGTSWHLSAIRNHFDSYETHLVRLLKHTRLERIQWINLNQRIVTLKTLTQ